MCLRLAAPVLTTPSALAFRKTSAQADPGSDLGNYSVSEGSYRIDSISTGKTVFNRLHTFSAPKVLARLSARRRAGEVGNQQKCMNGRPPLSGRAGLTGAPWLITLCDWIRFLLFIVRVVFIVQGRAEWALFSGPPSELSAWVGGARCWGRGDRLAGLRRWTAQGW